MQVSEAGRPATSFHPPSLENDAMEPIAYDPDIELKKQVFAVILFLERMKTAVRHFDHALRKEFDMARLDAAAAELKTLVDHVMQTGNPLVPADRDRRG